MRILIPVWNEFISPVFDAAQRFMLVEADHNHIIDRQFQELSIEIPLAKVETVLSWKPEMIICGAISRSLAHIIESSGVDLYPWLSGNVDQVLAEFIHGQGDLSHFLMPGCKEYGRLSKQCRHQGLRRRGRRHGCTSSRYRHHCEPWYFPFG